MTPHVAITTPALTEPRLFAALHPELSAWFAHRFTHFTSAQRLTIPEILAGHSTLLASPTGSGKTLAAFTAVFDHLARAHDAGTLPAAPVAIYVSPLRALAYDLQKNLNQPLAELGWNWLRVGSRTGDTPVAERARQKKKPPHIFVTTPESLTLLLSTPSWVPLFRHVRYLIVDELHALAENKRGTQLFLTAERLEDLVNPSASVPSAIGSRKSPIIRVGLSATVAPLETVASLLVGPARSCRLAVTHDRRPARIEVFSPLAKDPYPPAGYTATRVLRELAALLTTKRTTLVFTNTRSGAESVGLRLKQLLPALAPLIEVHHASLDRAVRLDVEDRLKRGELRAVVCSTSLELGIDIGAIDTVVMISAPKGVARALQRIGRSGHAPGESSHGLLVATNINDLAECAVTARLMARRELEPVRIPENSLDVLAQALVGLAVFGSTTADEAYALVRRSYPYRDLPRSDFDRVINYLEGGGRSLEKNYAPVFGKLRLASEVAPGPLGPATPASASAPQSAIANPPSPLLTLPAPRIARDFWQNVGTIASETHIQVRLGRRNLGTIEEGFMKRLRPGDIFVLNGRTVRLLKTTLLTATVAAAESSRPTVPSWNANKMPLASGLAAEVVKLRTSLAHLLDATSPIGTRQSEIGNLSAAATNWLIQTHDLTAANAAALAAHFALQARVSAIPTSAFFLIECFVEKSPDRAERLHYFFHSLIGRSANDALSRIVAQRVQVTRGGNALVTIDDYGFLLTLQPFQAISTAEAWRELFSPTDADAHLRLALAESELVKWQFRGVAQTGLMVPRRTRGEERGARSLQWSAEIIFDVLRRHEPDHPLLREAYAEATLRFLDTPRALVFLATTPALPFRLIPVERVSPFAFGLYVSGIRETMTLEDPETTIERLYHNMYGTETQGEVSDPPSPPQLVMARSAATRQSS